MCWSWCCDPSNNWVWAGGNEWFSASGVGSAEKAEEGGFHEHYPEKQWFLTGSVPQTGWLCSCVGAAMGQGQGGWVGHLTPGAEWSLKSPPCLVLNRAMWNMALICSAGTPQMQPPHQGIWKNNVLAVKSWGKIGSLMYLERNKLTSSTFSCKHAGGKLPGLYAWPCRREVSLWTKLEHLRQFSVHLGAGLCILFAP